MRQSRMYHPVSPSIPGNGRALCLGTNQGVGFLFIPDVIGLSIRLVHGYVIDAIAEFKTRHLDLRLRVKAVVDYIRQVTTAPIILGGPGFNYRAALRWT